MVKILYFGRLCDVTGCTEDTRDLPSTISNTSQLRQWLDIEVLHDPTVRVAVNMDVVIDPHPIKDGDEIAFLPPVGGG